MSDAPTDAVPPLSPPARTLWDAISLVAATVPLGAGYWCADRIGDLIRQFGHLHRASVHANLRQVLGEPLARDDARMASLTRDIFRHSARDFYDLLRLCSISRAALARSITPIGSWAAVDDALARGTGAIFVAAHLGSFDFALQAIVLRDYPTIALTVPTVARPLHDGLSYLRGSKGLVVAEATKGIFGWLAAALRDGTSLILATDRDFQRRGEPVVFFGRPTTLPIGAVRLARDTGAPIVALICRRHGQRHTMVIEEPVWVRQSADARGDLARGLAEIVAILERHIRATPEQWVMFQRVWPDEDGG